MDYPKRTELEKSIMRFFESGVAERTLEEGRPEKFPLSIAWLALLRSFEIVDKMQRHKELEPILKESNLDMLFLEYSIYCLSSCSCFISLKAFMLSKEQRAMLLNQLLLARHAVYKYYSNCYPQEDVARHIKQATEDYMRSAKKVEGTHSKLLVRLTQCIGKKDFSSAPSTDFDFISGVFFGSYVVSSQKELFFSFLDEVNKTSVAFFDIPFSIRGLEE